MAFSSAPKVFQSLENTHRKRSVSSFFKSLEFYASSIELSEDGKNGKNLWGNPKPKWAKNGLFGETFLGIVPKKSLLSPSRVSSADVPVRVLTHFFQQTHVF